VQKVPHPRAIPIEVTPREQRILEQIVRQQNNPQWLVTRAKIVLRAAAKQTNSQSASELDIPRNTVCSWRKRWQEAEDQREVVAHETDDEKSLRELLVTILQDNPRSGSPGKFSAEQMAQIIAIACEDPAVNGYPVSHWTPKEIVMEAVKRGVVMSISERQVGRFLKRGGLETPPDPLLAQHDRKRPAGVQRTGA
jgi:putative transposase